MPLQTPLHTGDPRRVGRYRLAGRLSGLPSDDPIFIGTGPDGSEVLINMLRGDWARDAAARDRFAAEATVAKRVPPFCAARVLDAGVDGADAYLVSEYVPGRSLLEVVSADGVRRGHDLEAVAIGMATGLACVHQAGLVHGNFGPEYVIMASDGAPKVVEFGITPPYGAATPSADMLAWAQTVIFAATGRPPVSRSDLDILPGYLREPVERCFDPDPSERPAARAVVQTLLGDAELPAGLLAEASRRAARPAARAAAAGQFPAGPRHSGGSAAAPRPTAAAGPGRQPQPGGQARTSPDQPGRSRHYPDGAQPGRRSARPEHSRGGRRTAWIVGGVVVMIALVAAVVLHLVQNQSGRLSADTGQTSPRASTSPSQSPTQGPPTPSDFAGTWSGTLKQPPTDTYHVTVVLTTGSTSGTVSYSGTASCSGDLEVTQATTKKLTLSQGALAGKCAKGQVTITMTSSTTTWFSFTSNSGPAATGSLTKR